MREIDFFVIGAGIAGMTFYRYLGSDSIVVADFHPGRYKIGESIIPPHFFDRGLRPLLEEARKLPSASEKRGTIFVAGGAVSFFHSFYDAHYTLHLDRQELEALYRRAFDVPILEERVVDLDLDRKIVRTEHHEFKVRRQIVDCSGPAMVVARHLGIARELWPVWAGWAYWDVDAHDDARFWRRVEERGARYYRFDDVTSKLDAAPIDPSVPASEVTMLTRFDDGIWTWQIPLFHSRRLSFGLVARDAPITRERYLDVARRALGPQYDATLRAWDESSEHNRFHRRDRFAWASTRFATPDWLLVGDAAFFGDPVYSVGTGVATNQAIRAATLIRDFDWETRGHLVFEQRTAELFERAIGAYEQWYAGLVTVDDAVADRIQVGFLNGLDLHFRTSEAYVDMWGVAAPEDPSCDPANEIPSAPVELPEALRSMVGFHAGAARRSAQRVEIDWIGDDDATLQMSIELRASSERAYRVAGPFALSYRAKPEDVDAPGAAGRQLFEAFAQALSRHQPAMLALLEAEAPRG